MWDLCYGCGYEISELDNVPCDGCHQFFHRSCLNYEVIEVEWDDMPKAFAFCEECND